MKTAAVISVLLLAGCAGPQENVQPFVAVAGTYALMEPAKPKVDPAACTKGCKCAGTGREPTGDGLSDGACRCPETCGCKQKGAPGWPPKSTSR